MCDLHNMLALYAKVHWKASGSLFEFKGSRNMCPQTCSLCWKHCQDVITRSSSITRSSLSNKMPCLRKISFNNSQHDVTQHVWPNDGDGRCCQY